MQFTEAGFSKIEFLEQLRMKKGLLAKNDELTSISINGLTKFNKDEWFPEDAAIKIAFVTYKV